MSAYGRKYTIATASTLPESVRATLPTDLNARWQVIEAYPAKLRSWNGYAKEETVKKWLAAQGLSSARVSFNQSYNGSLVEMFHRDVTA